MPNRKGPKPAGNTRAITASDYSATARPNLSPQQWEELARYVERQFLAGALRAIETEALVRQGVLTPAADKQIAQWRTAAYVARMVAYTFRTGDNGPWATGTWGIPSTRE
jgi:hypothetical protein